MDNIFGDYSKNNGVEKIEIDMERYNKEREKSNHIDEIKLKYENSIKEKRKHGRNIALYGFQLGLNFIAPGVSLVYFGGVIYKWNLPLDTPFDKFVAGIDAFNLVWHPLFIKRNYKKLMSHIDGYANTKGLAEYYQDALEYIKEDIDGT